MDDFDPWTDTGPTAPRPYDGAVCVVRSAAKGLGLATYCGITDTWYRSSRYTGPLFQPFSWADAYMVVPDRRT